MAKVSATARLVSFAFVDIDGPGHRRQGVGRLPQAAIGDVQDPGQGHVAQGEGAGAAHRAGHVRHAIVQHVVDDERRVAVGGGPAGGHAAALVDGHVDDHAARLHQLQVFALDQPRGLGAGHQHGADHQVGAAELLADGVPVAEQHGHVGRHDVVEVAEPVHVDVQQADVGAEAGGDAGGVGADHAPAENGDVGRLDARHPAQQNAAAHLRAFEILGPLLDAHPAGHLAHGRQQGQPPVIVAERLVGHGDAAAWPSSDSVNCRSAARWK